MDAAVKEAQRKFLQEQVKLYSSLHSKYALYAETLVEIFGEACKKYAPQAVIQARPKAIASFAEKILRKNKYKDPVNEITDLCGARVITHIPEEVIAVGQFIRENFIIDEKNSVDVTQRLKPTEFGYRSAHYIIQFKADAFPSREVPIEIPNELYGIKAEVQVRTILEHSWADFSHDMSYKGSFKIPQKWERELAGLAATLEAADQTYSRIHTGLKVYASNFGAYMSKEQMQDELAIQELILRNDPENLEVAHRIGKIAIVMGDWEKAISTLSIFSDSNSGPIIRDLGVALCYQNSDNKNSKEFQKGQDYLEKACQLSSCDTDALCYLASTYKGMDESKVREKYAQAFSIDPTNPNVLGNYLETQLIHRQDISDVPLVTPLIEEAIKRSISQAEVAVNLQWVYYDIGRFYLFLGRPYESLGAYAKALQVSLNDSFIEAALKSIDRLSAVSSQLTGYEWVKKLLLMGLASKFPNTAAGQAAFERIKKMPSSTDEPIKGPVVIVAGGCSSEVESEIQPYQGLLDVAFRDFKGTIISGGTVSGVSGLVGSVQQKYGKALTTIGYLPKSAETALLDKRYRETRFTDQEDFSASEPLQYWIDLLKSNVNPSEVKIIGINGGKISAIEYKVAIGLGAITAVLEDSKKEAEKLLMDKDWCNAKNLIPMLNDQSTAWAFVQSGKQKQQFDPMTREKLGQAIHERFINTKLMEKEEDPSLKPWGELKDYLRESNMQQAENIERELKLIGCSIHKVQGRRVALMQFSDDEIDMMAELEHARFNVERLLDGWKRGPKKDIDNKISPFLVPWSELAEITKEKDREIVKGIPKVLAKVSLEVRRKE
jgi:ppGpp synthetase/RelA/SpoT-type nucleotidyltranferase